MVVGFLCALCASAVCSVGCGDRLPELSAAERARALAHGPRLDGVFIAILPARLAVSPARWTVALDEMRARGWRELILADRADGSEHVIELILAWADRTGMGVALTTPHDRGWYAKFRSGPQLLAEQTVADLRRRWGQYGHHRCIDGFYNYPEFAELRGQALDVRRYYRAVSAELDRLRPGLRHVISPYCRDGYPVELWAAEWRLALAGSGVDAVALQDGVGVRLGVDPRTRIPVWRALAGACRGAGVELWGNVEGFRWLTVDPVTWRPATAAELAEQIGVAAGFGRLVVSWEAAYLVGGLTGEVKLRPTGQAAGEPPTLPGRAAGLPAGRRCSPRDEG